MTAKRMCVGSRFLSGMAKLDRYLVAIAFTVYALLAGGADAAEQPAGAAGATALVQDNFDSYPQGRIITDHTFYRFADFPKGGTSESTNPSAIWEADSGKFLADNGWGFSGKPSEWADRYFFRLNTRRFDIGDAEFSWKYRSAPFGENGYPVTGSDAVDLWLRYQTQYCLYTLQFDRTNNVVVVKRKVPAQGWCGPANLVENKGVYYTLYTDAAQPRFGAGQQAISWGGLSLPNLAHDLTVYRFKARVVSKADGAVQIQLWRDGQMIGSWLDRSDGTAANGERLSAHLAAGYFNSVPGWQAWWGQPISRPGAVGFRADNIKFWFDDFEVKPLP